MQQAEWQLLLRDDTEEDLVGASWHQEAIRLLVGSTREVARAGNLPWHVGDQLTLVLPRPGGSPWRPAPDMLVHPTLGQDDREELDARLLGIPVLVIEVASRTTWRNDVNIVSGKAAGYLAQGIPEYLVFDPTAAFLHEPWRGWRLVNGQIRPWQAIDGRYRSEALGIALAAEGPLPRVYDRAGRAVPWPSERAQAQATLEAENARLRAELDRLRGQSGANSGD